MSFGANSNNPRQCRAYAHAILAKARGSGETADFEAAQAAVNAVGTSRKSRGSNFGASLLGIAIQDHATGVIVESGHRMLDPTNTLRHGEFTPDGDDGNPLFVDHYPIEGLDPAIEPPYGLAFIAAAYSVSPDQASEPDISLSDMALCDIFLTEVAGDQTHYKPLRENDYPIPLHQGTDQGADRIDIIATRAISDEVRTYMAALASHVQWEF